ncbi:hypothetical protein KFE25_005286 [Diacronema lutheri]|uniref:NodB homology domain-containing protein n=1 Tax=Diacronema lutheri TaxID=2081491 RepID=A0A8J5XBP7_DIALT|nr:hypothetical protein KFE25_005286 [Diacronema lutheri]
MDVSADEWASARSSPALEEHDAPARQRTKLFGGDDRAAERAASDGGAWASPTGIELLPVADTAASAAPADADADGALLVRLGRGGFAQRSACERLLRLSAWLCACAALLPLWAACAAAERCVAGRGSLRSKMVAWRFVALVWHDAIVVACALLPASYGSHAIWCFPPGASGGCCALTVDDAPGRDPEALCELLDALREAGARATFFVTTDYAEGLVDDAASAALPPSAKAEWRARVAAALRRLVREGHELAHHMPQDRPYAGLCARDEGAFRAELARAERVLRAVAADARTPTAERPPDEAAPAAAVSRGAGADAVGAGVSGAGVSGRWFRPPSAVLSARMAAIVRHAGYRIVLCDAYSADPWIDGGAAPRAHVCRFHAEWLSGAMRAGSIAVLHTPERAARRQTIDAVRALVPALRAKGLRCVTLSELAQRVLDSSRGVGAVTDTRDGYASLETRG